MKKDFLPNLVIIVATTLLVVVVFYNIYVFVPSIQKTFGNLADWFMVVITAITAVFIYRTLNSQMEVQRDQNRIFRIEEQKYLGSIKPTITFNDRGHKTRWLHHGDNSPNNKLLGFIQTFNLTIDKDCVVSYRIFNNSKTFVEKQNMNVVTGITNEILIDIYIEVLKYEENVPKFDNLFFEINYIDKDKNEYHLIEKFNIDFRSRGTTIIWERLESLDKMIKSVY